jgi:septation ring formation regulator EzrA
MINNLINNYFMRLCIMTLTFFFMSGCSSEKVYVSHNMLVEIESDFVDEFNASETLDEQGQAVKEAHRKVGRISTDGIPEDYKNALLDVKDNWEDLFEAIEKVDQDGIDACLELSVQLIQKCNEIAEAYGLEVSEP